MFGIVGLMKQAQRVRQGGADDGAAVGDFGRVNWGKNDYGTSNSSFVFVVVGEMVKSSASTTLGEP